MRLVLRTLAALKHRFLRDDLHRSSTLLIAAQGVNAVSAFAFWLICARLFPASQVGLATAFISFGLLVATFTHVGLPTTVLRFLPTSKQPGGLFSAAVLLVTLSSLAGGGLAIWAISHLAPRLSFVQHSLILSLMLVAIVVGSALGGLLDGALSSLRASQFVFIKALLTNAPRVLLPFAIAALGMRGMVGVYSGILLLGVGYSLAIATRRFYRRGNALGGLRPRLTELRAHRNFAAANYLGSMFGILPGTLTPLIVLQILGPTQAAFFYMPMQLAVFFGHYFQLHLPGAAGGNSADRRCGRSSSPPFERREALIPIVASGRNSFMCNRLGNLTHLRCCLCSARFFASDDFVRGQPVRGG